MNIINNKYLKLFLVLGIALMVSFFSMKNIFIAQSPKINPFFAQNMMAKASNFWSKTTGFIASMKNPTPKATDQSNNTPSDNFTFSKQQVAEALKTPLTKVSQGVYAGKSNDTQVYEVRTGEIDYLVYTFNVNGKEVKIKVPKGQQPPSQATINALYK